MEPLTLITDSQKLVNLINGLAGFTSQYLLISGIIMLILLTTCFKNTSKYGPVIIFVSTLVFAFWYQNHHNFSFPLLNITNQSGFFYSLGLISGLLSCFLIETSSLDLSDKKSELYVLLLVILLGVSLVSLSGNLLILFLGLECISIPSYCLAAYGFSARSSESAMKYILYGSATSGVMIFGMSVLYGLSGTLDINSLVIHVDSLKNSSLFIISIVMILCGLLFKIAAFPFQTWAPDVYEGAPTPIVAFFSATPKAMAFYSLIILSPVFLIPSIKSILIAVSIISMTLGNLLAINQSNAKRMLAYSSVSHSGFLLMGILSSDFGIENIMYYLTIYIIMNFSAFHLLEITARKSGNYDIKEFSGLAKKEPYLAVGLLITMISLTGLPPAAGFSAKLFMFSGVYEAYKTTGEVQLFVLLAAALLNTVLSLFYYLKMPFYAFFRDYNENNVMQITIAEKGFIVTLNALLLLFFIKPDWIFKIIKLAQLKG